MRGKADAGEACLHCGYYPTRAAEAIVFQDGDLSLYDRCTGTTRQTSDPQEQLRWHAQLACIALQRGYKPGWAAHKFKEKFGHWPPSDPANSGGAVARGARVGAQPDHCLGQIQTGGCGLSKGRGTWRNRPDGKTVRRNTVAAHSPRAL